MDTLGRFKARVAKLRDLTARTGCDPSAIGLSYRVSQHLEVQPKGTVDGQRKLFTGGATDYVGDIRALAEVGVSSFDFGLFGPSLDATIDNMKRFRDEVISKVSDDENRSTVEASAADPLNPSSPLDWTASMTPPCRQPRPRCSRGWAEVGRGDRVGWARASRNGWNERQLARHSGEPFPFSTHLKPRLRGLAEHLDLRDEQRWVIKAASQHYYLARQGVQFIDYPRTAIRAEAPMNRVTRTTLDVERLQFASEVD